MSSDDRALTIWEARDRDVVMEADLESNFSILKEVCLGCGEQSLRRVGEPGMKEIPVLADFEAGPRFIDLLHGMLAFQPGPRI